MIKTISIGFISTLVGFVCGIYFSHPLSSRFLEIRLFEILQLLSTLFLGGFIAYYFSQRLNSWGKRSEIIYKHLSEMLTKCQKGFEKIEEFLKNPTSIPPKEITLFFKGLSSNIATLEKHRNNLKLNVRKISSIRESSDKLNELIVKDTWGTDPSKMVYSNDDKDNAQKEFTIITNFIEDLRFELYK